MRKILVSVVLLGVFVTGCARDQAFRYYDSEKYPPTAPDKVEILTKKPDRPFRVIADFQARNVSEKYMQIEAAKIGADAVIVGAYGGYRAKSDKWAGEDSKSKWHSRQTGTAIKYER